MSARQAALRERPHVVLNRRMTMNPDRVAVVTALLHEEGYEAAQRHDERLSDLTPEHVVWIWGNLAWFPQAVDSLVRMPGDRRPLVVLWHVEPLPLPRASGRRWPRPTMRELGKIVLRDSRASDVYTSVWNLRRLARHGLPDIVVVTTHERAAFLRERGGNPLVAPMGWMPADGEELGLERDRDVLFLGTTAGLARRKSVLRRIARSGIDLTVAGDYANPAFWGDRRTELLNRHKILLSVARFPGTLGGRRFVIGMSCGTLVVSDPVYDPAPFVPGTHFVEAPDDELVATLERYLSDDAARGRIAAAGHELVTTELAMPRVFRSLLGQVEARARRTARA